MNICKAVITAAVKQCLSVGGGATRQPGRKVMSGWNEYVKPKSESVLVRILESCRLPDPQLRENYTVYREIQRCNANTQCADSSILLIVFSSRSLLMV